MVKNELIELVQKEFKIDWDGIHGARHMARVLENGLRVAEMEGAKKDVVALFAYLHDSKRLNNSIDPEHGKRAKAFSMSLRGSLIMLKDEDFELLAYACEHHTDGLTEADVTIQTCWDADRLDLGRIGISPDPAYLCTDAAKQADIIEWAYRRSRMEADKT